MPSGHVYAIFSARYDPLTGGVESFTKRIAQGLVERGNRVIVVTSSLDSSPVHEVQEDGVEVYRLPAHALLGDRLPISRKNADYKRMMASLEESGVDRVLVNTRFYRHSLEGVRFARRIGAPVLVLDHGSAHLALGNRLADLMVARYEHAITRRLDKLRPSYAGISSASVRWLEHFGIRTEHIIPNAIDAKAYRELASARDFREELGLGPDDVLVSFVGRLAPEKGALEFAQAAALLEQGYVLALAGEGNQRAEIQGLCLANVVLLGNLSQSDLSALLRDANIFCLPTRSEGFCTSLLEAASHGTLPVMPHVGGTEEVMGSDDARFGILLDDRDATSVAKAIRLAAQLTDDQRSALAEHVSRDCSWEKTVEALEAAFEDASGLTQDPA